MERRSKALGSAGLTSNMPVVGSSLIKAALFHRARNLILVA